MNLAKYILSVSVLLVASSSWANWGGGHSRRAIEMEVGDAPKWIGNTVVSCERERSRHGGGHWGRGGGGRYNTKKVELTPGESARVEGVLVTCEYRRGGRGGRDHDRGRGDDWGRGGGGGRGGYDPHPSSHIECWCQPDRGRGGDLVGWYQIVYRDGRREQPHQVISTQVQWSTPGAMGICKNNIMRVQPSCRWVAR